MKQILVRFVLVSLVTVVAEGADTDPAANNPDSLCGPRCVVFALDRIGVRADLVDLVKELQWPQVEDGTTMLQLRNAIRNRGVSVTPVKLRPGQAVKLTGIAIVHFERGKQDEQVPLGHYACCMPTSDPSTWEIFNPPNVRRLVNREEFCATCSSVMLLIQPSGIALSDAGQISVSAWSGRFLMFLVTTLTVAMLASLCRLLWQRAVLLLSRRTADGFTRRV